MIFCVTLEYFLVKNDRKIIVHELRPKRFGRRLLQIFNIRNDFERAIFNSEFSASGFADFSQKKSSRKTKKTMRLLR